MTDIHLIAGNTGAGKSTYAARLSAERDAHVFAVDEWMRTLFFPDMPEAPSYDWALARTKRCDVQVMTEALRLADRGVSSILDLGFFGRAQRDWARDAVEAGGHRVVLHVLDVPKETRWARIEERNQGAAETYQFEVSRETFEFCETIYEAPTDDERAGAVVVVT